MDWVALKSSTQDFKEKFSRDSHSVDWNIILPNLYFLISS